MNFSLQVMRSARDASPSNNQCGQCAACCNVMGVPELGKPYYARCPHLEANCTIYPTRPGGCRGFRCVWHLGVLGEKPDYRPDRLGLMLSLESEEEANFLNVYEVVPGALTTHADRVKHLLARIKSHKIVKNARWHDIAIRYYPYGADISADYPISPLYAPYIPPTGDIRVDADLARGEATFSGDLRGFLHPSSPSPRA